MLERRRTGNGYSANAFSPSDVEAWCRLNGVRLSRSEFDILDEMEVRRLAFLDRDTTNEPQVSNRPMSAELFDGLFG